jgi:p-hydroxybenzoate 3-monooxygenase
MASFPGEAAMRTQVGIVGAGPAGLMLSHLLHRSGIQSIVLENRSRAYVEQRVRAGVLEQWAADLLVETGVGERLQHEAMWHDGIFLCFDGALHHLDFRSLVGKGIAIYGQQEIVKDLIARRLADGGEIFFEVEDVRLAGFESASPTIAFRHAGAEKEISCNFIAGCDGSHGICRPSFPSGMLTAYERDYPFAWLGILAEAPPPERELIYAFHARGFALCSMRSPTLSRLYLQCAPDEDINAWPDDRIWQELQTRLDGTRALTEGKIWQRGITPMRSFVAEPMKYGRLFLAGDAAHVVPPTGAKGMNLAFADVLVLSRAIDAFYASGASDRLDAYSSTCLRRVWRAQRFSLWMTQLLHRFAFDIDFDYRRQLAELDYVTSSRAAATALAENYVGLPLDQE